MKSRVVSAWPPSVGIPTSVASSTRRALDAFTVNGRISSIPCPTQRPRHPQRDWRQRHPSGQLRSVDRAGPSGVESMVDELAHSAGKDRRSIVSTCSTARRQCRWRNACATPCSPRWHAGYGTSFAKGEGMALPASRRRKGDRELDRCVAMCCRPNGEVKVKKLTVARRRTQVHPDNIRARSRARLWGFRSPLRKGDAEGRWHRQTNFDTYTRCG